ncbi:hypothetical protein [Leptospira interrogans]|uniref:hypothetical protein n=1 Tax=Leptospira interrogans TaxID=173 RepID=UPI000348500A|nr:hypothetical protein [Leptospira interrogans]
MELIITEEYADKIAEEVRLAIRKELVGKPFSSIEDGIVFEDDTAIMGGFADPGGKLIIRQHNQEHFANEDYYRKMLDITVQFCKEHVKKSKRF